MRNATIRLLALLVAAMFVLSGCSMIVVDEEMDNAELVAEFDGGSVTKGEAKVEYDKLADMYEQYGYSITNLSDEDLKKAKESLLNDMVKEIVVKNEATSRGYTDISDEKKAELDNEAEESFNNTVEYYASFFQSDSEDESRKQATDYLAQQGYTLDAMKQDKIKTYWSDLLFDDVTKDVTVTDEQKETAYQTLVSDDESKYSSDVSAFETAVTNGTTIAWFPEGYRTVKHILIKLSDDEISAMSDLTTQLEDVQTQIADLQQTLSDAEATPAPDETAASDDDAAAPESDANVPMTQGDDLSAEATAEPTAEATMEPAADTTAELDAEATVAPEETPDPTEGMTDEEKLAYYQNEETSLQSQIDTLKTQYTAELMPKAQEVMDLLNGGADFDEVMAQYGEDPGMQQEPGMTTGYYVSAQSTMWDQAFTDAAMALQNVGDISQPVLGSNGLHIIKYVSDVTSGAVDNDEVRQLAADNALEDAKNSTYDAAVQQWIDAANVKLYVDRMNF